MGSGERVVCVCVCDNVTTMSLTVEFPDVLSRLGA